jgi:hypothetical protein
VAAFRPGTGRRELACGPPAPRPGQATPGEARARAYLIPTTIESRAEYTS